jgi:hypothetical protein
VTDHAFEERLSAEGLGAGTPCAVAVVRDRLPERREIQADWPIYAKRDQAATNEAHEALDELAAAERAAATLADALEAAVKVIDEAYYGDEDIAETHAARAALAAYRARAGGAGTETPQ